MLNQAVRWLLGLGVIAWVLLRKSEHQQLATGVGLALLAALNPHAAAGAAFGCCFYLAMPQASHGASRLLYAAFSWGIGYAAGVFFYGDGPPFSPKAMLVAAVVAAVAVLVFISWSSIIKREGNLPPWVQSLLDIVSPFKKRGNDDAP